MRGTTLAMVFVLALNVFFFWGQQAVNDINPSGTQFFNYQGSHIAQYDQGNYTLQTNPTGDLPGQVASVSPETGNIFTDPISYVQNWLLDLPGVRNIVALLNTVPNILKSVGFPVIFAYTLGYMWYAFSFWILVIWLRGGE